MSSYGVFTYRSFRFTAIVTVLRDEHGEPKATCELIDRTKAKR